VPEWRIAAETQDDRPVIRSFGGESCASSDGVNFALEDVSLSLRR
jgi:hypothetical protein